MMYIIKNTNPSIKDYINKYGKHFNEKLCNFAVELMTTRDLIGNEIKLVPWAKNKVDSNLIKYNVTLNNNHMWDYIYVANVGVADYLGRSIPDDHHLMLYIKDTIDDIDGEPGTVFCRWLADMKHKNIEIDWSEML